MEQIEMVTVSVRKCCITEIEKFSVIFSLFKNNQFLNGENEYAVSKANGVGVCPVHLIQIAI